MALYDDLRKEKQVMPIAEDSCLVKMKDSDTRVYTCDQSETVFTCIIPYFQYLISKHHAKVMRKKNAEGDIALLEEAGSGSEVSDNDDDVNLKELLKKISPEPYGTCLICERQFNGPRSYTRHMKSKSHAKQKCELQLLKKMKVIFSACEDGRAEETCEGSEKQKVSADAELPEKPKCKDCNKDFSTVLSFARHLTSKTHEKRSNQNKLLNDLKVIKMLELEDDSSSSDDEESSEVLGCEICGTVFSSPWKIKAHIRSKKHQKNLKWTKVLFKKAMSVVDGSRPEASFEVEDDTEKHLTKKETDSQSPEDGSNAHTKSRGESRQ